MVKTLAQHIGQQGEDAAVALLQQKGWRILARNWRKGLLELDIICQDRDTIVFVEVKTRKGSGMQKPHEALSLKKQRTLVRAAQAWLAATQLWDVPCRFDLVTVTHSSTTFTTELISHAFELSQAMGGGNTPWQP